VTEKPCQSPQGFAYTRMQRERQERCRRERTRRNDKRNNKEELRSRLGHWLRKHDRSQVRAYNGVVGSLSAFNDPVEGNQKPTSIAHLVFPRCVFLATLNTFDALNRLLVWRRILEHSATRELFLKNLELSIMNSEYRLKRSAPKEFPLSQQRCSPECLSFQSLSLQCLLIAESSVGVSWRSLRLPGFRLL